MPGIYPGREDALLGLVPTDTAPRETLARQVAIRTGPAKPQTKRGGELSPTHLWLDGGGGASGVAIGNPYVISSSSLVVVFH